VSQEVGAAELAPCTPAWAGMVPTAQGPLSKASLGAACCNQNMGALCEGAKTPASWAHDVCPKQTGRDHSGPGRASFFVWGRD
jgi:hypothetical protein